MTEIPDDFIHLLDHPLGQKEDLGSADLESISKVQLNQEPQDVHGFDKNAQTSSEYSA